MTCTFTVMRWIRSLDPILRIYEGCGRTYLGEVEGANIVKIHRRSGKISYLVYPEFESDPHPALLRCVRLNLRTRQIECYDYATNANPPVLHRKETFLSLEDPRREKFARLTAQEEKQGLLNEPSGIGTRDGWQRRLSERGFALKGHRLVRSGKEAHSPADWTAACVRPGTPARGAHGLGKCHGRATCVHDQAPCQWPDDKRGNSSVPGCGPSSEPAHDTLADRTGKSAKKFLLRDHAAAPISGGFGACGEEGIR